MALATILILGLHFLSVLSSTTVSLTVEEENVNRTFIGNIAMQAHLNISNIQTSNIFSILTNPYSDFFKVTSNGDFFVVKNINREVICQRQVPCIMDVEVAVTQSTNLTVIKVEVTVIDINDNSPIFSPSTCNFSIPEGPQMGTSYVLSSASDVDVGINSIQRFVLEPEGTGFGIEARQNLDGTWALNLILNLTLDRETLSSYNLILKAIDGGNPSKTAILTIGITVFDINDNRPVFASTEYNTTIDEDVAILTEIIAVNATDRDTGENGRVSYYFAGIEPNSVASSIGIEEDTGKIFVKERLSSQKGPLIVIFIEARDHGDPVQRSNQCKVTIHVRDKNDNVPAIQINVLGNVTENSKIGTPVALIQVTDTDTGLNGEAVCTCNNENFMITNFSKNNFRLDVGSLIDREMISKYFITINCSDKGEPPLSSNNSFDLWVQDENDNAPQFTQSPYTYNVQENNAVGAVLLRVTATDSDIGNNSMIRYQIQPFEYSSNFLIDEGTGIVKANKSYDYEEKSSYQFNVTASDYGQPPLSNWTTVTIYITDVNDNEPKFNEDSYAMSVMENANIGKSIGQVIATDKDSGNNGRVSYMIPAEYRSMPFKVLDDGTVITTAIIDRELNNSFKFAIMTTDHGDSPRNATVPVYITVLDQNDNKPIFEFPSDNNNTISIPNNIGPNVAITTVIAIDADDNNNSLLTYNISDGNADGLFQIIPLSGKIYLMKSIPVGDIKPYLLTVSVRDGGDIPFEAVTTLHVNFYAVNDPASGTAPSKNQNIVIAVVISCLTFVLSLIIIAVICTIWRKDHQKQPFNTIEYDEQKIIEGLRNSNGSISSKGSMDKILNFKESMYLENGYQNTRKKEVNFAIDGSHDTGVSMETDGHYEMTLPSKSSSIPTQSNEISLSESQKNDDKRQRELHRMTSFKVQQALTNIQSNSNNNNNNKQWLQSPQVEMAKTYTGLTQKGNLPLDDSHSDLSGETITSDSGRGGSVEDIRSNMVDSHDSADQRSPTTLPTHPFYTSESKRPSFSSFHGNSVHKAGPILSSYLNHKNPRYTNGDIGHPLNDLLHHHGNNIYSQQRHASESNLSTQFLNIKSAPAFEKGMSLVPNKLGINPLLQKSKSSNLTILCQLNYENVNFRKGSVTAMSDDATTTTSGSYTITDPQDDSQLDMTNMFYKPDTFV